MIVPSIHLRARELEHLIGTIAQHYRCWRWLAGGGSRGRGGDRCGRGAVAAVDVASWATADRAESPSPTTALTQTDRLKGKFFIRTHQYNTYNSSELRQLSIGANPCSGRHSACRRAGLPARRKKLSNNPSA